MSTDDEDPESIRLTLRPVDSKAPVRFYCDVCRSGPIPRRPLEVFMTQVEHSAEHGCRFCAGIQKFVKTLQATVHSLHFHPIDSSGFKYSAFHHPRQDFTVYCKDRSYPCEFFRVSGIPARQGLNSFDEPFSFLQHPFIRPMRRPSGDTSSDEAFCTLKRWILQCDTYHSLCGSTKKTMPYRILEIEFLEPLRIRVVEDSSRSERYACLSHRWAKSETESKSLTTHNLELYKAGIPEDRFYPLVRDAITATSKLDLRFIWIDCYCIVQNDKTDWEKEAANMASIYENAYLTISATSSEDGRSMFSATPLDFQETQITEIDGEAIFARKQLGHPCQVTDFDKEEQSGALLTRAWVFQERHLSNRFIHFTTEEIFWECRESTWCECASGEGAWTERRAKTARTLRNQKWESIAEQYNETQLSFEKDRLPALAGVAKLYGEEYKKTYLAGLWEEDLPRSLAWGKYPSKDPDPRPLHATAPTWSWLSLPRGPLVFQGRPTTFVRLLTWVRKPPGADIYTGANRTEITVEGPVLDLSIFPDGERSKGSYVGRTDNDCFRVNPDFNFNPEDPTKYRAVPSGTSCSLLLLSNDEDPMGRKKCFGILLVQVNSTDGDTAVFERIGFLDDSCLNRWRLEKPGKSTDPLRVSVRVSVQSLLRKAERRKITII